MILADAHVHIYECFDLSKFLNASVDNFNAEAVRIGHHDAYLAVLFLTETRKDNKFHDISGYTDSQNREINKIEINWSFHRTEESCSINALRTDGKALFLMAGRQIVTAENLEVLALATEKIIEDGMTLKDTIQDVNKAGAIPVIPWGAGKWLGRRGKILEKLLNEAHGSRLFLGDNGGRPMFWSRPSHFQLAEKKGIPILPGSDPLPFDNEWSKPGSFGFSLENTISREYPAKDIKKLLMEPSVHINSYGKLEKPFRFFQNQIKMQVRKQTQNSII